jgi:hypothetical protein
MKATSLNQTPPATAPAPGCTNCGTAALAEALKKQRLFEGIPLGKGIDSSTIGGTPITQSEAKEAPTLASLAPPSSLIPGADKVVSAQLHKQLGDLQTLADRLSAPLGSVTGRKGAAATTANPVVSSLDRSLHTSATAHEKAHQNLANVIERAERETARVANENNVARKPAPPNVDNYYSTKDVRARHAAQRAAMRAQPPPPTMESQVASATAAHASAIPKSGAPPVTPRRRVPVTPAASSGHDNLRAAAAHLRESAAGADVAANAVNSNLSGDTAALLGRLAELQTKLKHEQQQTEKSLNAATERTTAQFSTLTDQTMLVGDVRSQLEKWDTLAGQIGDFTKQTTGMANLGHVFREHVSALSFLLDDKNNYATATTNGPLMTMVERHRGYWLHAHLSAKSMANAKVEMKWMGAAPAQDLRSNERGAIQFEDVLVDKEGRVWVIGTGFNQGKRVMSAAIARFQADAATLDPTFCVHPKDKTKGSIRIDVFEGDSQGHQLLMSPDGGRIYMLSTVLDGTKLPVATISALKTSDGTPDDTFGIPGQKGHLALTAPEFIGGTVGVRISIHPSTGELVVLAGALGAAGTPALTLVTMLTPGGGVAEPFGSIFVGASLSPSVDADQGRSWIGTDVIWAPGPTPAEDRIVICGTIDDNVIGNRKMTGFVARLRRDGHADSIRSSPPQVENVSVGALGMRLATVDGKAEADAELAEKDLISRSLGKDGKISHTPGFAQMGAFIRGDPPLSSDAKSPFVAGPRAGRVGSASMITLPAGAYPVRMGILNGRTLLVGNEFLGLPGREQVSGFAALMPADGSSVPTLQRFTSPNVDVTRLNGVCITAHEVMFVGMVQRMAAEPDTSECFVARVHASSFVQGTTVETGQRVALLEQFHQNMNGVAWHPLLSKHILVGLVQTGRTTHSRNATLFVAS